MSNSGYALLFALPLVIGCAATTGEDSFAGGRADDPTVRLDDSEQPVSDEFARLAAQALAKRYEHSRRYHWWPQATYEALTRAVDEDLYRDFSYLSVLREVSDQYTDPMTGEPLVWSHLVEVTRNSTGDVWIAVLTWSADTGTREFTWTAKTRGYYGRETDEHMMQAVSSELAGADAGSVGRYDDIDAILAFEKTQLNASDITAGPHGLDNLPEQVALTAEAHLSTWNDSDGLGNTSPMTPQVRRVLEVRDSTGSLVLGYVVGVTDSAIQRDQLSNILLINEYGFTLETWYGECRYPDAGGNC